MDFQTLVPSWYIDGSNFCFEARYESNHDFGAPAAPPYPNVHGVNPPGRFIVHIRSVSRIFPRVFFIYSQTGKP